MILTRLIGKTKKKLRLIPTILLIAFTGFLIFDKGALLHSIIQGTIATQHPKEELLDLTAVTVVRVIDGDTIVVNINNEEIKVRLIGVDTPESVASQEYLEQTGKENTEAGKIASNWLKSFLYSGRIVYLETDVQQTDKYGRLLAYVWLSPNISKDITTETVKVEMLNGKLLATGLAALATYPPNVKYVDYFTVLNQY